MKKDKARFTIKFCPTNPRHQEAMQILDGAGRRKASLIADALYMYFNHGSESGSDLGRTISIEPAPMQPQNTPKPEAGTRQKNLHSSGAVPIAAIQPKAHAISNTEQPCEDELLHTAIEAVGSFFS